jgi:hypothetical protein
MRYVTRPLTIEARTRLRGVRPVRGPFSATWSQTLTQLKTEVRHLGASEFVMQIDVEERHIRLDGGLRADARPLSPSVAISVDRPGKAPLLFVCGKFTDWRENVRAIALGLEALRRVERYGIVQAEEQYTGFGALPPGVPMPAAKMTVEEAQRILRRFWHGAASERNDWALLYLRGARELHPDAGGDPAEFRRLTEARDLLIGGDA